MGRALGRGEQEEALGGSILGQGLAGSLCPRWVVGAMRCMAYVSRGCCVRCAHALWSLASFPGNAAKYVVFLGLGHLGVIGVHVWVVMPRRCLEEGQVCSLASVAYLALCIAMLCGQQTLVGSITCGVGSQKCV